ncbi:MAG: YHS domain-containing protein [Parvularculaceae bacterium]|nr:YHS domain-containing protein [Parvularculaceae bacterium]
MPRPLAILAAAAIIAAFAAPAFAAKPEIYTGRFSNLAVGGYDVVAYFDDGAAVKGAKDFSYDYEGAVWRFTSEDNLERFKMNPAAFEPQYGGYCAWAVSQGYTASANPENWTIHGGKLYLNYDDRVQADWLKDPDGFIAKADRNWPAVLSK